FGRRARFDTYGDSAAGLQLVHAVGDHSLAGLETLSYRGEVALRGAHRDRAPRDGPVRLSHINVVAALRVLDSSGRHQHSSGEARDQQPRVHELIGKKRVILVSELSTQLDGAGRLI